LDFVLTLALRPDQCARLQGCRSQASLSVDVVGKASPALIGSNPEEAQLRSQLEVLAQEEFYCLAQ
jgi:hypothetical protein